MGSSRFRRIVRRMALSLLAVPLAAAGLLGLVYGWSAYRLDRAYPLPAVALEAPAAAGAPSAEALVAEALVAEGRRLAALRNCFLCHGPDLGGRTLPLDERLGAFQCPNLTRGRGGVGGQRSDEALLRAMLHGIAPDGRALRVMPAQRFRHLADADVRALLAYVRAVPAVDRVPAPTRPTLLARALLLTEHFPMLAAERIDHSAPRPAPVPPGRTAAYGRYLATACVLCHHEDFAGGPIEGMPPQAVPAANLTPHPGGLRHWSQADFARALREGRRPDGTVLDPQMPWRFYARFNDMEVQALWRFLRTLPAQPSHGSR